MSTDKVSTVQKESADKQREKASNSETAGQ